MDHGGVLVLMLALVLVGCGGRGAATQPVGTSTSASAVSSGRRPLELTVQTTDGRLLSVGELRGKPTLLFLFATFDGVSQAALRPLGRFVRDHPDVHVLGIAVQPSPEPLLEAWEHALDPPFPLSYDPEQRVAGGTSPLGSIDRIPTFVVLDVRGRVVERHVGFASARALERMLRRAQPTRQRGSSRGSS